MPTPTARFVDSHAHVFVQGLPLTRGARHAPGYDATLTDYLALLDAHDIAHGVLTAPSFLGTDNHFLLQALGAARGRLRGTVIVDPAISRSDLEALDRQFVVGVRLNFFRRADRDVPDLAAPEYRRLFEACAELDWHVEIYGEGARLAQWLPPIVATGVKVVVDHFGSPDPELGLDDPGFRYVLSELAGERMWVKLSAPYRVGYDLAARAAEALLREAGPQRLVWGSDWPWTQNELGRSFQQCLEWLGAWVPDETQREQLLSSTALSLFKFD